MRHRRWTLMFAGMAMLLMLAACSDAPNADTGTDGQAQEQPEQPDEPANGQNPPIEEEEQPMEETPAEADPAPTDEAPDEGMPPTALEAATTVMRALSRGDMNTVAAWAHAEKGVRFSPYAYVDVETDLVFSKAELEGLMKDDTKRVWRTFAGSGDLIEMTYADYHSRFVYDAPFMEDGEIALNNVLGESTTVSNLNEVYPAESYDYVEYHIAGIDPAVEGMDWRSIRLVFEKIGDDRALVGIVHDQWTP